MEKIKMLFELIDNELKQQGESASCEKLAVISAYRITFEHMYEEFRKTMAKTDAEVKREIQEKLARKSTLEKLLEGYYGNKRTN